MEQDKKLFHVDDNTLSSVLQVYNKTEQSLAENVKNLKKWMHLQHHLPEILGKETIKSYLPVNTISKFIDDKTVQNFLILNKCNAEKAKEKIDMYYTARSQLSHLARNMNPRCSNMKEVANLMYHVPLPKLTKDMCRVFVNKYRTTDKVGQIDPYDILKMAANLQEIRLKEDIMFRDIFIFDIEGTCMGFLSKLTPNFAGTAITLYQVNLTK